MPNDDFYMTPEVLSGKELRDVVLAGPSHSNWARNMPRPAAPTATPTPRHLAYAAAGVNQEIVSAEVKLNDLRKAIKQTSDAVMDLDISVARMTNGLHAPGGELADAKEKIEDLEKQVRGLIKEAQRQKKRADAAEAKLVDGTPEGTEVEQVSFLRRTPGDAIRYFAGEVMKHAEADTNSFLAGAAMGLRMVADDVDRLPQG